MQIQASVGTAPKSVSLDNSVYSLRLVAQTHGERQWLAGLLKAVEDVDMLWKSRLRDRTPQLRIVEIGRTAND